MVIEATTLSTITLKKLLYKIKLLGGRCRAIVCRSSFLIDFRRKNCTGDLIKYKLELRMLEIYSNFSSHIHPYKRYQSLLHYNGCFYCHMIKPLLVNTNY